MARVPGGFGVNDVMGVRRPDRSVALDRPVGSGLVEALLAQAGQRTDPQVPGWMSNIANSTLGGILSQGSHAGVERAASEWAAQGASMTPAAIMQQQRLAGGIDEALDWVRPLALADLGVSGVQGSMMFPFPGLAPGVAPAARAARRAGGGIAGALRRLLGSGDEAVSAAATAGRSLPPSVAHRAGRPYFRNVDELEAVAQPAWEGGVPLYHGTNKDFEGFTRVPQHYGLAMGEGAYTTTRAGHAANYAADGAAIDHALHFGTPLPENVPSYVHSVKFAGAGEPRMLDYGAAGIPDDAKNAVKRAIDDLQESLTRAGGTVATVDELAPLYAKLDNPNANFAGVHLGGDVVGAHTSDNLKGTIDWVLERNFEEGVIGLRDMERIQREVMDTLRTGLLDAGYHGYRAPQGGNFTGIPRQGTAAHVDADVYVWLAPDRDLTMVGSGQHWPTYWHAEETGLGVPVEDFFGSADDIRLRRASRDAPPPTVPPLPPENRFKDMTPEDPWGI